MALLNRRPTETSPSRGVLLREELEALRTTPILASDVVLAETKVGAMYLHADDQYMTPFIRDTGEWEAAEATWLHSKLRPGQTMLDVGGNVGYFTLLGAKAVGPEGRVVSIEPERRNLSLLRMNVWQNGHEHVDIIPAAAWHRRGALSLRHNDTNAGDHQVHNHVVSHDSVIVPAIALDDLFEGRSLDVVKIDTQGVDHDVVTGLARTLEANPHAPLLIEYWLQAFEERGLSETDILAGYRALNRPLKLLGEDGRAALASDDEILTAARNSPGLWVNLVIDPA